MSEPSFHQPEQIPQSKRDLPKAGQPEILTKRNRMQIAALQRMTSVEATHDELSTPEERELKWALRYAPIFAKLFLTNPAFEQAVLNEDAEKVVRLLSEASPSSAEEELH